MREAPLQECEIRGGIVFDLYNPFIPLYRHVRWFAMLTATGQNRSDRAEIAPAVADAIARPGNLFVRVTQGILRVGWKHSIRILDTFRRVAVGTRLLGLHSRKSWTCFRV